MAAADTARLIAELSLKDKFSGGMKGVLGTLDKAESRFGRIGGIATKGVQTFSRNVALIGVGAGVAIAGAVKTGLSDLAELESAVASVDGAIQTLGLTGQITGKQVADWANQIESDIGAAFDDKAITAAAATLLRYGKVAPKNLKPALTVMTDLAAKTGDVDGAASLLAKALADPTKAAGKLARQGIILTDQQKKQIDAMVKAGDTAGAQAKLLDILAESTKGAARASQGPYARSLSILNDVAEDARKALAEGFLPIIEKVADRLGKAMGDPKFIEGIRSFGKTLAGGLDDLIDIAAKLPWSTIGESLKIAGAGARTLLNAFTSLPPWVQTAVITGWGLNKLTGGALGGIVGEIGKGLIKGVLGMNAGVVNLHAGVVNGGVGGAAGGGAVAGGTSKVSKAVSAIGKVVLVGAAVGAIVELKQLLDEQTAANKELIAGFGQQSKTFAKDASLGDLETSLKGVGDQMATLNAQLTPEAIAYQLDIDGVKTAIFNSRQEIVQAIDREQMRLYGVTNNVAVKVAQAGINAVTQGQRLASAIAAVQSATRTAGANSVAAIRAKRWLLNVKINQTNRFTIRDYVVKTSQTNAYGPVAS